MKNKEISINERIGSLVKKLIMLVLVLLYRGFFVMLSFNMIADKILVIDFRLNIYSSIAVLMLTKILLGNISDNENTNKEEVELPIDGLLAISLCTLIIYICYCLI
jgi:hypothetical protein